MENLLSFNRYHPATGTPPHYHHSGFTHCTLFPQPSRRVSCYGLVNPKVSCNIFADHGGFRSTMVEFRRRDFLFNQPVSYQKTWQLHAMWRFAPPNGAVTGLILANAAVFLLWKVADKEFMSQNFTVQLDNFNSGRYHTLITSSFSHKGISHIVSNMMLLYVCGNRIGQRYGSEFLLKLYLVGAFAGSSSLLLHKALTVLLPKDNQLNEPDRSKAALLGASDAVLAIHVLDRLLTAADFSLFGFTIPLNALLVGRDIWEDIQRVKEGGNIAGIAHLGGAAVGIMAWVWLRKWRL